jgi:hypothetical protein
MAHSSQGRSCLLPTALLLLFALFPLTSFAASPPPPATDSIASPVDNPTGAYDPDLSGVSSDYGAATPEGTWEVVTISSGVSGIHWAITPIVNTLWLIDRSDKDNR